MNKISGVYGIRSLTHPERVYIGSSINIRKRWSQHKESLRLGTHHNAKLQNHYNKHGKTDLVFEAIIQCDQNIIIAIEQTFIDRYMPWFNVREIADSNFGVKHTAETNQKNRERQLGKRYSEEAKRNMGLSHLGTHRSKDTKRKMSEAQIGKRASPETREKLRLSHLGQNNRSKLTINIETGIFYESMQEAAGSVGKSKSWLCHRLLGRVKNNTMFRYA